MNMNIVLITKLCHYIVVCIVFMDNTYKDYKK